MDRRRESAHSSNIAACLHKAFERTAAPGDLCTRLQTCCRCESVHAAVPVVLETPSELKRLLPIPNRFMCHRIWGSDHCPEAGIPSHTAPQPSVDASVVTTTREVTNPRGTPRLKKFGLRHGARASMQPRGDRDTQTVPRSMLSRGLEFSATAAVVACVISPDDTLPKLTPWVPVVSEILSNEQSCLLWNGVGKTKWPPRALARGGLSFLGSPCKLPNTEWTDSGARMLFRLFTHSPRDSRWISSESIWLSSVSRDWAKISQSSR